MMQFSYIEGAVSLIEAARMSGQGAGSKDQTALQPTLKRAIKHDLKGVSYA